MHQCTKCHQKNHTNCDRYVEHKTIRWTDGQTRWNHSESDSESIAITTSRSILIPSERNSSTGHKKNKSWNEYKNVEKKSPLEELNKAFYIILLSWARDYDWYKHFHNDYEDEARLKENLRNYLLLLTWVKTAKCSNWTFFSCGFEH